jgi:uncharacterized protein YcaQ
MRHRELLDRTIDSVSIDELRRFAVARNFFDPTTLQRALDQMGFVQADPIRAPARAQDLILRHRVKDYKAGDLERRYATLNVEEDFFINYGYVSCALYSLMHPRKSSAPQVDKKRARLLLEFMHQRGEVHPREVDEYFSHGKVTNYWGGSSNATTHLMDAMHYHGMLRVLRREKGIRIYAPREQGRAAISGPERRARVDALVDAVVRIYAPLTASGLTYYVRRLRYAAPQWEGDFTDGLKRARQRLARINTGLVWFYPPDEDPFGHSQADVARLLAPFDPLVHDRARFELLWNWEYRFEAYTPIAKRKLGYYAMPLLWRDRVIGWANLAVKNGALHCDIGYAGSQPRERVFKRELDAELDRIRMFLALATAPLHKASSTPVNPSLAHRR